MKQEFKPKIFKTSIREYPEAIELEKFVLSAMWLKKGEIVQEVAAILTADDFYRAEHTVIYKAIIDLYNEGNVPNMLSTIEKLHRAGVLRQMDVRYVLRLGDLAHTTAYVAEYAKIIKQKSNLRKMITVAENIAGTAGGNGEYKDILKVVNAQIESLRDNTTPAKCYEKCSYFNAGGEFETCQKNISEYYNRKTGFDNLDENQIFAPGLYVIGGLPATGKTTFCWQLLEQLAKSGEKCVYASYEMGAFELFSKTIARDFCLRYYADNPEQCTLSAADIRRGAFSQNLSELIAQLSHQDDEDLTVMEVDDKDIDELLLDLRRYCRKGKAPVVCIDYLQIIPHDRENAKQGIDDIVRRLKNFQRETNATVIVISSFNRQNYSQPVSFESFKESGNIEYSADVVWGLQLYFEDDKDRSKKDKVDDAKKANPRQVQLVCLKNRQGSNYDCDFLYYPRSDLFLHEEEFVIADNLINSEKIWDPSVGEDDEEEFDN